MDSQDGSQPPLKQVNNYQSCLIPKNLKTEIQTKFLQICNLDFQKIIYDFRYYNSMLNSENTFDIFQGLVELRRALLLNNDQEEYQQFINDIIQQNMIAPIIHIINSSSNEIILYESLWIITNLTSGSSDLIKLVLQNGLLSCLLKKFNINNYHILTIELVCWIYGNIAADSNQFCDQLFKMNTFKLIIEYAQQKIQWDKNQKQIETIAWVINNYRNFIPNQYFMPVLQLFSKWIHLNLDQEALSCICWAYLSFLKQPNCLQKLIDLGVVPRLVQLVEIDNLGLFHSNLAIILNILENQNYFGYLIGLGIIPCLEKLLNKHHHIQHRTNKILSAINLISNSTIELRKQFLNSQVIESLIALSSTSQLSDKNILYQIFGNVIEILETYTFKDQKLTTCLKVCELVVLKYIQSNKRSKKQLEIIQIFCKYLLQLGNKLQYDCKQSQFLDEQQQELIQRTMLKIQIIEQKQ